MTTAILDRESPYVKNNVYEASFLAVDNGKPLYVCLWICVCMSLLSWWDNFSTAENNLSSHCVKLQQAFHNQSTESPLTIANTRFLTRLDFWLYLLHSAMAEAYTKLKRRQNAIMVYPQVHFVCGHQPGLPYLFIGPLPPSWKKK